MIKNLNQLRRTLREGTQLEILDHCRPECIGPVSYTHLDVYKRQQHKPVGYAVCTVGTEWH